MSDFEDKLKETLESAKEGLSDVADKAKDSFQDVVSEGREVAEEMKAAATGQKLESDVEGAAGYRADESTNSTLSIVALVVGILSIVFAFVYVWVGLALGIAGVIISARARKQSQTKMATAGFVCSIVGLVLSAVFVVCALACAASVLAFGGLSGLKG
ncbi:MAG: DUF4190 domain-containing protein [Oscillospiraceae bacterium]|nr:DUF4190 domain-containing protein [Oscillospiraceae bacterium]